MTFAPSYTVAETIQNELGEDFTFPTVDLSGSEFQLPPASSTDAPQPIEIERLTTGVVKGDGAFDRIMASNLAHLKQQYEAGNISSDQYTKAYIELTSASLSAGLEFVLQGETTYWNALAAQSNARTAEIRAVQAGVELETAKAALVGAQYQAKLAEAKHLLTLVQVATEDAKFELIQHQKEAAHAQYADTLTDGTTAVDGSIGKQKELYNEQIESYKKDANYKFAKLYVDSWITQKTLDEGLNAPGEFTNTSIDSVLSQIRSNLGIT